jgi:hypothetical protein
MGDLTDDEITAFTEGAWVGPLSPDQRDLVIEVCHDLIARAMRNEADPIPSPHMAGDGRAKEAAIRTLLDGYASALDEVAELRAAKVADADAHKTQRLVEQLDANFARVVEALGLAPGGADTDTVVSCIALHRESTRKLSERAADAERVRGVVYQVSLRVLTAAGATEPHLSSDADAIADRVAEQLAGARRITREERDALQWAIALCSERHRAILDRMFSGAPAERLAAPADDAARAATLLLDGLTGERSANVFEAARHAESLISRIPGQPVVQEPSKRGQEIHEQPDSLRLVDAFMSGAAYVHDHSDVDDDGRVVLEHGANVERAAEQHVVEQPTAPEGETGKEMPGCTGLTARWCPQCGTCACPGGDSDMNDVGCPLHAPASQHAVSLAAPAVQLSAADQIDLQQARDYISSSVGWNAFLNPADAAEVFPLPARWLELIDRLLAAHKEP